MNYKLFLMQLVQEHLKQNAYISGHLSLNR